MMVAYTKKQGQYLAFIHHYTKLHGVPPAEADIQKYFRTTAPSVHQMIVKLEEKGLISKIPRTPRTIKVLLSPDQLPDLGDSISKDVNLNTAWSQSAYLKAYRFAADAHKGQEFPGTDLPYIMHISFVSMEIIAALNYEKDRDGDLAVQCALLHDVIEDTDVDYDEVKEKFGEEVADGVLALSKKDTIAKDKRMLDSLKRIKHQPHEVWMVKMADRITNLAKPPHYWGREKISRYRDEAVEIYNELSEASDYLSRRLIWKIHEYGKYC
jgi:(p)ppGpp synthase/HD superfamily hydrolase